MNEIIINLLWVTQVIAAILIVVLVLLQHGKGADAGATFGSGGGSASLFGASGSSNFLSKSTAVLAAVFFITTFGQVFMASGRFNALGVMSTAPKTTMPTATSTNISPSGVKANSTKPNQIPN